MVSPKEDLQKISELGEGEIDSLAKAMAQTITAENEPSELDQISEDIGEGYTKACYRFSRLAVVGRIVRGEFSRIQFLEMMENGGLSGEKAEIFLEPFIIRKEKIYKRRVYALLKKVLKKIEKLERKINSSDEDSGNGSKLYG